MSNIFPVILSGGSGTRLWPLSRKHYPKQLLKLAGEHTMLQETALRVKTFGQPIVVCNDDHRFMVAEQLQSIDISPTATILEPVARNTAPAIALAAFCALQQAEDAVLIVLAADHVIKHEGVFHAALDKAISAAEQGDLVTFGVVPTKPETGYGYIQATIDENGLGPVQGFVEKPSAEKAQQYMDSGEHFWNSGMFVFKAETFLQELKRYNQTIYTQAELAFKNSVQDLDFIRVDKTAFSACPADSIDYAVMEHTDKAVVVSLNAGWSDVGSFSSLWDVLNKDENNNVHAGDVHTIDTHNCLIQSENQFIATIGIDDLIVIGTKDSILVAKKDRVQDVKAIVQALEQQGRSEHLLHREVFRPWGSYDAIDSGKRFQVKRICVKPGASLSLQMHHHRAEHWIVVSGTALVEVDGKETVLCENESSYIPLGSTHRLSNPGKIPLELIEVQSGSYFGEDDIVRFEDTFGRC